MQELEERSERRLAPQPRLDLPRALPARGRGPGAQADESAGRRAFQLTDAGRAYVEENREALGVPWEAVGGDVPEGLFQLRELMMQLGMAAMQVAQAGDEAQTDEARQGPRGGPPLALPDPRRRRRRRAQGGLTGRRSCAARPSHGAPL